MKVWQEQRFGDLVHFPPRVSLRKGDEYPFIEMDALSPDKRYVESAEWRKYQSSSCSKFSDDDVLLARITPCLENGKIAQARVVGQGMGFGSTEFFVFRAKHGILNQSFLYYLSKSALVWKSAVNSMVGASGRQRADATFLRKVLVQIPTLSVQEKIAAVLSTYDELIESNKRRIALLENLAEEIYREWFVRFRFPGHEKVKIVKGVPQGWEQKRLPEIADITYGFPFEGARFNTAANGKPIIRIRNIPESSTDDFTDEIVDEKYLVRHGDLLIGMDGEFHINHWQGDEAYLVQRVCRLKAKQPELEGYLARAIRAPIKHFESILMGATVGHLGAMHLKSIVLLVPPKQLRHRLHVIDDIHRQKLMLSMACRQLSRTRDMLLPRLLSGKLFVENLDIQFPPAMAEDTAAPHPNLLPAKRGRE